MPNSNHLTPAISRNKLDSRTTNIEITILVAILIINRLCFVKEVKETIVYIKELLRTLFDAIESYYKQPDEGTCEESGHEANSVTDILLPVLLDQYKHISNTIQNAGLEQKAPREEIVQSHKRYDNIKGISSPIFKDSFPREEILNNNEHRNYKDSDIIIDMPLVETYPNRVSFMVFFRHIWWFTESLIGRMSQTSSSILTNKNYLASRFWMYTADIFTVAIGRTVTVEELRYSYIFPGDCRMFLSIPCFNGGYIHDKDGLEYNRTGRS